MLLALLMTVGAWAQQAPCAFTAPSSEVVELLNQAESAYQAVDVDGFTASMDEVLMLVPCLSDRMIDTEAARLHRMMGIQAFVTGDETRSKESLTAAARVEPTYRFPPSIAPASHPIALTYGAVQPQPDPVETVPPAIDGPIRFDGKLTTSRPVGRATVFQLLDEQGAALSSAYLYSSDALPDYAVDPTVVIEEPEPKIVADLPEGAPPAAAKKKPALLVASIGALVVGTAFAGIAASQNDKLRNPLADERDEWEDARETQIITGTLAYALWAGGGVGTVVWVVK